MNSLGYVLRGDVEEINLSPILMCTIFVAGRCFWLAFLHRRAWIRTGRQSDMMQLAMTAAIYDGIITLFAGLVLLSTPYMLGTVLEPLASVTDSILVWVLCCTAILSYVRSLRHGVAQLAGYPARAPDQLAVRHVVKRSVSDAGGRVVDVALVWGGRKLDAVADVDFDRAVSAVETGALCHQIETALNDKLGPSEVIVALSKRNHGYSA